MYDFSLIDKLNISKLDVVIIPCMVTDLSEADKLHEIISLIIDYMFPSKKIYIKLNQHDYYSLYQKWFPQCILIDGCIQNEIILNYTKMHSITTLNFNNSDDIFARYSWLIPVSLENLSTSYLHLLYLTCKLIAGLEPNYNLKYLGKDNKIFDKFCDMHLTKQPFVLNNSAEKTHKSGLEIIVVNDLASEFDICKLWKYIESYPQDSIIIFLNNERRYLFYIPDRTEIIEYIIPFSIKITDERKELKMTANENILYLYTTDKEIQKKLLATKIDKSLNDVGLLGKNLNVENLYLRGMLDATELKVMHLLEILKNSEVETSDIN